MENFILIFYNGQHVVFQFCPQSKIGRPKFEVSLVVDSMNTGNCSQLGKHRFDHCTILLEYVIIMRTSCFDNDLASQMTKLPLIHSSFPVIHKVGNVDIFVLTKFEKYNT